MPLHVRVHAHVFCACTRDSACAAMCTCVHPRITEEVRNCAHTSILCRWHCVWVLLYTRLLSAFITADVDYFVIHTNEQKPTPPGRRKCKDTLSTQREGKWVITVTIKSGSIVGCAQPGRLREAAVFRWPRERRTLFHM